MSQWTYSRQQSNPTIPLLVIGTFLLIIPPIGITLIILGIISLFSKN